MSDTVSRHALNDLIKNRLSKVLVYASDAEEIKDPFDRGKATAYQNILYDISTKLSSVELEKEIESLKAITELAVNTLKQIANEHFGSANSYTWQQSTKSTLSEIERLQNGST